MPPAAALFAALGLLALSFVAWRPIELIEDAYITLRYVANLNAGHGLVWNPGEPPVEGFTSWLHLALLVVVTKLGLDDLRAAALLGYAGLAVCAGLVYQIVAVQLRLSRALAVGAAALLMVGHDTLIVAQRGLETTVAMAVCVALYSAYLRFSSDPDKEASAALVLFAFLLPLTRPELVVVSGVFLCAAWIFAPGRRRVLALFSTLAALTGAALFALKWSVFGAPFPTAFYVKGDVALVSTLGIRSALDFAAAYGWLVAIAIAGAVLGGRRRELWPALVAGVVVCLVFCRFITVMNYNHRYFMPVVVLLLPAGAEFLELLWRRVRLGSRRERVVALLLATCWGASLLTPPTRWFAPSRYGERMQRSWIAIGKSLATIEGRAQRTLAVSEAGAIPYYSNWRVVDTGGLNDMHLAQYRGSRRDSRVDVDYVFARAPEVLVLSSDSGARITSGIAAELLADDSMASYQLAGVFACNESWFQWCFVRTDAPDWSVTAATLRAAAIENSEWAERRLGVLTRTAPAAW